MNADSMTGKRSLELPSDNVMANKRQQFSTDIDLETLVSQIQQNTSGNENPPQLTIEEIEGALASFHQNQNLAPGPSTQQQVNTDANRPIVPLLGSANDPQSHVNAQAAPTHPQLSEPLRHSAQYNEQLRSQFNVDAQPDKENGPAMTQLRGKMLPYLDSLACQLLESLSSSHHQETLNIVTQPLSDRGRVYRHILDIFEETKRIFVSEDTPFLTMEIPGIQNERSQPAMVQRINLATFCAAIFGTIPVGFAELNRSFTAAFVPEGGRLLKSQNGLFLELKTQAYISALSQKERPHKEILDELFPLNMAEEWAAARGDRQQLTPAETDFIARCTKRRENIESDTDQVELAKRYQWVFFLRDLSDYIGKHYEAIAPKREFVAEGTAAAATVAAKAASPASSSKAAGSQPTAPSETSSPASASVAASTSPGSEEPKRVRRELGEKAKKKAAENNGQLHTGDTLAEYSAARSSAEGQESVRPRSSALTRRSWTKEEEEALLRGLDKVQGPYWAQILELYGPGGSISEVLKDRTQVQLKDKARNLKMFFVRVGLPVPAVFEYVTGDYETRRSSGRRARDKKRTDEVRAQNRHPQPVAQPQPFANQPTGQQPQAVGQSLQLDNLLPVGNHAAAPPLQVPGATASSGQPQPLQDDSMLPTAEALDRALNLFKEGGSENSGLAAEGTDNSLQHLIQSVGDYINNQQ